MVAWTGIARREHSRDGLRYPSDMTDREWLLAAPFIPPAKRGGRRRTADMREVLNAMLYIAASGCAWRLLPKCFPPVSTVRRYFYAWRDAGLFDAINTVLVMNLREIEGREASPSAGVIDSQSDKTTESGGISGFDAGKRVKGRKRHILTDTCGLLASHLWFLRPFLEHGYHHQCRPWSPVRARGVALCRAVCRGWRIDDHQDHVLAPAGVPTVSARRRFHHHRSDGCDPVHPAVWRSAIAEFHCDRGRSARP